MAIQVPPHAPRGRDATSRAGRKPGTDWSPWLVGGLTAVVLGLFLVYPIGKTLVSSFVAQGDPITWRNLGFGNFERFFTSPLYQRAFVNSLVVSLSSTAIATLLALPAAYAMARIEMGFWLGAGATAGVAFVFGIVRLALVICEAIAA